MSITNVSIRAKAKGSGTGSASSTIVNVQTVAKASTADYAEEAGHAEEADKAAYADKAGHATKADYATTAGYAESISEDSELWDKFLRKDVDDTASGVITFLKGILFGDGTYGIDENGDATLNNLVLNDTANSTDFVSGFLSGKGWAIRKLTTTNTAGEEETYYELEIDNLVVRGTLRVYEFVVSQLLGENDNRIFTGMMEVDHYDSDTGKVYLKTQDGKLYNPFRIDDCIMVQQYCGDDLEANNYYVTKHYECVITGFGIGSTSDGEKRLDWVTFDTFTTTMEDGTPEDLITEGDTFVRVDNLSDDERKGIVEVMTVGASTPYIDIIYGLKTDPDNSLKARFGNLTGIYNTLFGWLEGWGAYVSNIYSVGTYIQRSTGETLSNQIEMTESSFATNYKKLQYDITEEDNYLYNATFTNEMDGWTVDSDETTFVTVDDETYSVNDSLLVVKDSYATVEQYESVDRLHIVNNGVTQANSYITQPGTHKEYTSESSTTDEDGNYTTDGLGEYEEVLDTLYLTLKFYPVSDGTLTIGFPDATEESGSLPYTTVEITAEGEWVTLTLSGTWDGTGDFVLAYTGDMYVDLLAITDHALDDLETELSTSIEQTAEYIRLSASNISSLSTKYAELSVTAEAITSTVSELTETVEGNYTYLYSMIEQTADEISSTVTQLSADLADGIADAESYAKTLVSNLSSAVDDYVSDLEDAIADVKDTADASASWISQQSDSILGVVGSFTYNSSTDSYTLTELSGYVLSSNFVSLFASTISGSSNSATAALTAYIEDEVAKISITADQISLEGFTTINGTFTIDEDGYFTATGGTIGPFTVTEDGLETTGTDAYISWTNSYGEMYLGESTYTFSPYLISTIASTTTSTTLSATSYNAARITTKRSASTYSTYITALQVEATGSSYQAAANNAAILCTGGAFIGLRFRFFVVGSTYGNLYHPLYGNVILFYTVSSTTKYCHCWLPALGQEDDGLVIFVRVRNSYDCYLHPHSGYNIVYDSNTTVSGSWTYSATGTTLSTSDDGMLLDTQGDNLILIFRYSDLTFYEWAY